MHDRTVGCIQNRIFRIRFCETGVFVFSVLCALFLFSNFTVFLFFVIFHAERFLSWNQSCSANNFRKKIAKNVTFSKHRLFLKFSEMKISDLLR